MNFIPLERMTPDQQVEHLTTVHGWGPDETPRHSPGRVRAHDREHLGMTLHPRQFQRIVPDHDHTKGLTP